MIVQLFTRDPTTLGFGIEFARAYAIAMAAIAGYTILAGALPGGSETLSPFIAKMTGAFGLLLGITYVGGVALEFGVIAAYVAIVADFVWRAGFVAVVFSRRRWLTRGQRLLIDRGSLGQD